MKKSASLLLFSLGLSIGIIGTFLFIDSDETKATQVRQGGYSLINPLLECEIGTLPQENAFIEVKSSVEDVLNELKDKTAIEDASIYLRDLNGGASFGINEEEEFSPASLLKLPVLMAYYKQAEGDKSLLSKKVTAEIETDLNTKESFRSQGVIQEGKEYSISDFLRAMIVSSDNNAMRILMENLSLEIQDKVYKDLGLHVPGTADLNDFMTVKDYASFFRILYNASYLTPEYSEHALKLLTEVEFKEGLVAGVPSDIKVAHKFGERTFGDEKKQLHDCGIVYLEDRPYLLCIMTRGTDYNALSEGIEVLSRHIYQELSSQE